MVNSVSLNNNSAGSSVRTDNKMQEINNQLKSLGVPEDVILQGPEAVKLYYEQHNIQLPQPPRPPEGQSDSLFGIKNSKDGNLENGVPAEIKQDLMSKGVPENIILQGREAVMNYCQQNNIQLQKEPPQIGFNLDTAA